LYDHASLTPLFDRLQSLYLLADYIGFPLIHASKIIDDFIGRRRQAFPHYPYNKEEVSVNIDGNILDMYFSGCPICAKI
jgi:hypothetical protein